MTARENIYARLALLDSATGDTLGERVITTTARIIIQGLAYRNGAIAIGGYISDAASVNHNMYAALLKTPDAIVPTSPGNGTAYDTCSSFDPRCSNGPSARPSKRFISISIRRTPR